MVAQRLLTDEILILIVQFSCSNVLFIFLFALRRKIFWRVRERLSKKPEPAANNKYEHC